MATWHQQRRPVKLYHEKFFSVVIDPPSEFRTVSLFPTRLAAEQHLDNLREFQPYNVRHAYIIPPKGY